MSAMADYEIWCQDNCITPGPIAERLYSEVIRREAAEALAREFGNDVSEWGV